jgi:hypothetical protein
MIYSFLYCGCATTILLVFLCVAHSVLFKAVLVHIPLVRALVYPEPKREKDDRARRSSRALYLYTETAVPVNTVRKTQAVKVNEDSGVLAVLQ